MLQAGKARLQERVGAVTEKSNVTGATRAVERAVSVKSTVAAVGCDRQDCLKSASGPLGNSTMTADLSSDFLWRG